MHNAGRMRSLPGSLASVAEKHRRAIVLVGHMNKSQNGKSLYRGLGSIDITAIVRSVLMVERDEDDPGIRYMFPIKSSLAAEGDAVAFKFDRRYGFRWIGPCVHKHLGEIEEEAQENKAETAERLLKSLLMGKGVPGIQLINHMAQIGISERTVNKIKKKLGITSYRVKNQRYWKLPQDGCVPDGAEAGDGKQD